MDHAKGLIYPLYENGVDGDGDEVADTTSSTVKKSLGAAGSDANLDDVHAAAMETRIILCVFHERFTALLLPVAIESSRSVGDGPKDEMEGVLPCAPNAKNATDAAIRRGSRPMECGDSML